MPEALCAGVSSQAATPFGTRRGYCRLTVTPPLAGLRTAKNGALVVFDTLLPKCETRSVPSFSWAGATARMPLIRVLTVALLLFTEEHRARDKWCERGEQSLQEPIVAGGRRYRIL